MLIIFANCYFVHCFTAGIRIIITEDSQMGYYLWNTLFVTVWEGVVSEVDGAKHKLKREKVHLSSKIKVGINLWWRCYYGASKTVFYMFISCIYQVCLHWMRYWNNAEEVNVHI